MRAVYPPENGRVEPRLPADCSMESVPQTSGDAESLTTTWQVRCPGSLVGRRFGVSGLASAGIDAPAAGVPSSYVIRAGSGPGLSNLADFDTGSLATSFGAAVPDGTYFARIHARNLFGVSGPSNEVQFTVGGPVCGGPPAPPGQLVAAVSGLSVSLTWGAATGAASVLADATNSFAATGPVISMASCKGAVRNVTPSLIGSYASGRGWPAGTSRVSVRVPESR